MANKYSALTLKKIVFLTTAFHPSYMAKEHTYKLGGKKKKKKKKSDLPLFFFFNYKNLRELITRTDRAHL